MNRQIARDFATGFPNYDDPNYNYKFMKISPTSEANNKQINNKQTNN